LRGNGPGILLLEADLRHTAAYAGWRFARRYLAKSEQADPRLYGANEPT